MGGYDGNSRQCLSSVEVFSHFHAFVKASKLLLSEEEENISFQNFCKPLQSKAEVYFNWNNLLSLVSV